VQQPRPDGQAGNQNAVKQPRKLLCVLAVLTLDLVASSGRPGREWGRPGGVHYPDGPYRPPMITRCRGRHDSTPICSRGFASSPSRAPQFFRLSLGQ
jgi:hypothetical protein